MLRLVRRLILVLAILAAPATAQIPAGVSAADRSAIRAVIESQLAAFRRDDGPAAFGLASPVIQEMFGTADNFLAMVRTGYAAVYRPRAVAFEGMVGDTARPVQLVRLTGPDGQPVIAAYEMIRMPDATWRINGCVLLDAPDRAA